MNDEYFMVPESDDAIEREARIFNALEYLAEARSTVVDHLSAPSDVYARQAIVQDLDLAESNLRKALR
ncbi:hypothetical protein SEA_BOBBY_106 [Mycobacterium phage Bobby]|nr:hypothetical protein SEA_BOBBY_106 [Mycobacterium phage Bobby]